ncbi:hypothetical protein EDC96DRAFT_529256 [Choanephora cucurbitarum]|nr:hypothetical protein EDC96DRAFT_529256 [Choanephora cucurbitarum]
MLQFWSDWKRKENKHDGMNPNGRSMMRSNSSDHSSPSNWDMDWNRPKQTLSFKDDYVSFPSLDPPDHELPCSS